MRTWPFLLLVLPWCGVGCSRPSVDGSYVGSAPVGLGVARRAEGAAAGERNSDGTPKVLPPSPPDVPGKTHVLPLGRFEIRTEPDPGFGSDVYVWRGGCASCFAPTDRYDVRVVVYRDLTASEVAALYPTLPGRSDHRLVPLPAALAQLERLERRLASLGDDDVDAGLRAAWLAGVRRTREELRAALPAR